MDHPQRCMDPDGFLSALEDVPSMAADPAKALVNLWHTEIYRHGDRSPVSTFPTNTVKEDVWPQGYGQLTTLGMQQQYKLGEYIKKRYEGFLSDTYKRKEIYVQSTDYDRTIMSAQANLAGLFPPTRDEIWNEKLLWQPIPVHTVPRSVEKLLYYPVKGCPKFYQLLKETFGSREAQGAMKGHMPFLTKLASYMGYDLKTLLDFNSHKLWDAYDTLLIQKTHNQPVPSWAGDDIMGQWKELLAFSVNAVFGTHKREEKSRLQGGLLVKDIVEKMTQATQSTDGRKMLMYSAHDITLVALQVALNVFKLQLPPYAACHFFELYKEDNGEYTIEMYYRTTASVQPHILVLPGCSAACPLQKFKELVSPVITNDWQKECNN
ncbi:prostatic acid phosphatase-like [Rhineura floridana]|uniref:prostatic acid phosphatase-like n=1 Tax=Rhineura floridana TaxID=261503 RepID=UPI002AC86559|nr:prostatic acid phosphatase-like [Rhineura floridana]